VRHQRGEHLLGAREAVLGVDRHRALDGVGEALREARHSLRDRLVVAVVDLEDERRERLRFVRPAPRQALVEHHADRVEVRARVDVLHAERLLRRHVVRRAHRRAGARLVALIRALAEELRDPEIEELGRRRPLLVELDEDVLGLEIAVDDAGACATARPSSTWQISPTSGPPRAAPVSRRGRSGADPRAAP
jgi:hypothetical protein